MQGKAYMLMETARNGDLGVQRPGSTHLEDLVGVAHGGDLVVGMGAAQLAEVAHGTATDLAVHVDFLHLMLWAHQHLKEEDTERLKRNDSRKMPKESSPFEKEQEGQGTKLPFQNYP